MFRVLGPGKYFGEISFFLGIPRTASALCTTFTELFVLDRKDFLTTLERFPDATDKTNALNKKCEHNNYTALGIKCYLCKEKGHVAI
jgi:hypothetical protein